MATRIENSGAEKKSSPQQQMKKRPMQSEGAENQGVPNEEDMKKNFMSALNSYLASDPNLDPAMKGNIKDVINSSMPSISSVMNDFAERVVKNNGNLSQTDMIEFMKKMSPIITNTLASVSDNTEGA